MATADLPKPGGPEMETIRQESHALSFSITVAHCPLRHTKFGTLQGIPPKFLKASVTAAPNKQRTE